MIDNALLPHRGKKFEARTYLVWECVGLNYSIVLPNAMLLEVYRMVCWKITHRR